MADSMGEKTISRAHFIGIGGAGNGAAALVQNKRNSAHTCATNSNSAGNPLSIAHSAIGKIIFS